MKLSIQHQESYARGELLLRTIFGAAYIGVPHLFLLTFIGIWSGILSFIAFWVVLFTGSYPQSWFEFQVKVLNWTTRLSATLHNLVDGYPALGVNGTSETVELSIPYPETLGRGLALVRMLFGGIYVGVPHGFCLFFRYLASAVLMCIAWFAVLFTGSYPAGWHAFNVGTVRWGTNVSLYLANMTDDYPKFTGKELEAEEQAPAAEPAATQETPESDNEA